MVKKNTYKSRKLRRARGGGYSFGAAVAPEAPYSSTVLGGTPLTPDCLASTRPGLATASPGGLPGFSGGKRKQKGGVKWDLANNEPGAPVLKGGRYTFDLGAGQFSGSAGPSLGSYPEVTRIGCEGGLVNTSPGGAAANPTPLQNGGVGGIDSAAYTAPTAGYTNNPSSFVDSVGAPILLQQPYDARSMNPACLKTGGRRYRKTPRKQRKTQRKSRSKSRKSQRKSRK